MTLKTLGKTTWDKIKVGEVFAHNFCWSIRMKETSNSSINLADDWSFQFRGGNITMLHRAGSLYKLPLSVQRLWRED